MELNTLGLKCPMPIVRLSQAVKTLAAGQEIRVAADDEPFPADVRAWCKKTGNTLVFLDESNPKGFVAIIRKEG